jgi:hypothetical protein
MPQSQGLRGLAADRARSHTISVVNTPSVEHISLLIKPYTLALMSRGFLLGAHRVASSGSEG